MPGQSDGDPLDRDLHSRPPSPLMPSSRGDWASYAPHMAKQRLLARKTSTSAHLLMYHPPEHRTIYNIQYQRASLLRCLIPLLAFLGDQIMPNSTPRNPQPGIYPILVAYLPHFLCTCTIP